MTTPTQTPTPTAHREPTNVGLGLPPHPAQAAVAARPNATVASGRRTRRHRIRNGIVPAPSTVWSPRPRAWTSAPATPRSPTTARPDDVRLHVSAAEADIALPGDVE